MHDLTCKWCTNDYPAKRLNSQHCGQPDCKRQHLAERQKLYARKRKAEGKPLARTTYERECTVCGEPFSMERKAQKTCSQACMGQALTDSGHMAKISHLGQIALHGENHKPLPKELVPQHIKDSRRLERLSPLRRAYEEQDWPSVIEGLRVRSTRTQDGCWIWDGKLSRKKNGGTYPLVTLGKTLQAHRVATEAKYGKPLGTNQAHHVCANSRCVNPDHLQAISARENLAEMRQRNFYIRRIEELEDALANVDLKHSALTTVSVRDVT